MSCPRDKWLDQHMFTYSLFMELLHLWNLSSPCITLWFAVYLPTKGPCSPALRSPRGILTPQPPPFIASSTRHWPHPTDVQVYLMLDLSILQCIWSIPPILKLWTFWLWIYLKGLLLHSRIGDLTSTYKIYLYLLPLMAHHYTREELLKLRNSPLVTRPSNLPPVEEWMGWVFVWHDIHSSCWQTPRPLPDPSQPGNQQRGGRVPNRSKTEDGLTTDAAGNRRPAFDSRRKSTTGLSPCAWSCPSAINMKSFSSRRYHLRTAQDRFRFSFW